jgi:hypothetical protein
LRPPRFVHVGLGYAPNVEIPHLDQAIESEALDWIRYSYFCYILWTSSDAETIVRKILRVPNAQQLNVFVCEFSMVNGFGFLPNYTWEWIKKDRGQGEVPLWSPESGLPLLP